MYMDFYVISLATGATGLAAMAVLGLSHTGHAGPTAHGGHDAGHLGHGGHGAHGGHAAHAVQGGHGSHAGHVSHAGDHGASWMQSFLSPRVLFAVMVGFGAGGLLASTARRALATRRGDPRRRRLRGAARRAHLALPVPLRVHAAVTLESAIEDDARAVTGFDANGNGLVAVDVDGQIVQLLATLTPDDRARGVRIRTGDVVRIAEVDAARGRCTVRANDR